VTTAPEHPALDAAVDAAVDVLGGTPASLVRPAVDPATFVLPPVLAERVRAFDRRVDSWFERLRGRPVADRVFYGASALGDFSLVWHLAGATGALRGGDRERDAVRLAVALGVESVLVNGFVKSFFRRSRPEWGQERPRGLRKPRSSSFPSGHATSGFMAATVLGAGRSPATKAAWYAAATVVASSRVHVKIHHPSDVVAGAAIGLALGRLAAKSR
jgi:undecaprenyl-diphosphatase